MRDECRSMRRRIRLLVTYAVALVGIGAVPANAWTPSFQLYLADQALNDALDGKVDIYAVDYDTGEFQRDAQGNRIVIGSYPVHPEILNALRSYPDQFRAGVLGGVAFPDCLTGRDLLHGMMLARRGNTPPPDPQAVATREWLQHLWERAFYSDNPDDTTPAAKAFVVGYLVYAGGEMYASALANGAIGAETEEGWQVVRQAMEQYVLYRAQPLPDWKISVEGIEGFIYRNMIDTRAGSVLDRRGLFRGPEAEKSIPYAYSRLRDRIDADIKAYYAVLSNYDRAVQEKIEAAKRCAIWDFSCSSVILYAQAGALAVEKAGYIALNGIPNAYRERWVEDIDRGLQALPGYSLKVAQALFLSRDPNTGLYGAADLAAARSAMESYRNRYVLSMAGLPDFVGLTIDMIRTLTGAIFAKVSASVGSMVGRLASDTNGLQDNASAGLGMSLERLAELSRSAVGGLTEVLAARGKSLQDFDQKILRLPASQRLEAERFPPAYNTLTFSKLVFLGREQVNKLLTDLAAPRPAPVLNDDNVALGFIESLDGADQWYANPRKLVLAADCLSYRRIFMRQEGETMPCEDAVLRADPSSVTLYAGQSQAFRLSPAIPVDWTLEGEGAIDAEGRFTTPGVVESDRLVTVHARAMDGTNREATASITLKAPDHVFRAGDATGMPGQYVRVPVLVNGLANIRSAKLRIHYDSAVLEPVERVNVPWVTLRGETRGTVYVRDLFPDPSLEVTLQDMGVRQEGLVDALFRIKTTAPAGPSPITLDVSDVSSLDIVSGAQTPVDFGHFGIQPGSVVVGQPSTTQPQILLRAGQAAGQPGTYIRVPVLLEGGDEVDSATITLSYDETVLEPERQGNIPPVTFRGETTGSISYQEQTRSIVVTVDNVLLREQGLLDFVFRIKDNAKAGRTTLPLSVAKVLKATNEPIAPDLFATEAGAVEVGVPNPTPPILVSAGHVYGNAGGEVSVPIRITGVKPDSLRAIRLAIGFDPAFMLPVRKGLCPEASFVGLTDGSLVTREKATSVEVDVNEALLREDGLVELKFRLSDQAVGTSPVGVQVLGLVDSQNHSLAPDLYAGRSGSVTVGAAPTTDEGLTLTLSSAVGLPGDVVLLVVSATKDARSVAGATLQLDLAAPPAGQPALEVLSDKITADGLFPSGVLAVNTDVPGRVSVAIAASQKVSGPGPLLRVPIRIPSSAVGGAAYEIGLRGSLSDGAQERDVPARGGAVTVKGWPAIGSGDITGDGKVDITDAILLLRAILGFAPLTPEIQAVGDVAPVPGTGGRTVGDGTVNVVDVIRILRMSAGLDRG